MGRSAVKNHRFSQCMESGRPGALQVLVYMGCQFNSSEALPFITYPACISVTFYHFVIFI